MTAAVSTAAELWCQPAGHDDPDEALSLQRRALDVAVEVFHGCGCRID